MADLPGYISDTELYYEDDLSSERNLLTGREHIVTGSDNLISGEHGTVVGNRNVLHSLDGAAHTLTGDDTFAVYADTIILDGTVSVGGASVVTDISAALDALGT